jgi:hypothetical protein
LSFSGILCDPTRTQMQYPIIEKDPRRLGRWNAVAAD